MGVRSAISLSEPRTARRVANLDLTMVGATLVTAVLGVVMVYTGSRATAASLGLSRHYFLERQAIFVLLGVIVMVVLAAIDYRRIELVGMIAYGLSIGGLLGVFVIGHSAQGAGRWISLGPIEIQPSEVAIVGLIVALATFVARRIDGLSWSDLVRMLIMAAVPILLVLVQPDLGTAIIMAVVLVVMLAIAGVPLRTLALLAIGAALVLFAAVEVGPKVGLLHGYQLSRLGSFLHQNSHAKNLQAAVYNTKQSKLAIGAGGLFGKGILHGSQTNNGYVPEQQTDFIFSAVGEQLGFLGSTVLLGLLATISWRLMRNAQLARDVFGRMLCAGAFAFVAFSTFQNAGMAMGIMPVAGVPLPFVSYGGSATVCFFAVVGVAVSVRRHRGRRGY
ncbi:MAG: FtsW/RodA/SpoVE family cell cycle protein [Acidimicrobiales bacterium]